MPTSPADDQSSGSPTIRQTRSDWIYEHADKILDRLDRGWRIFRPVFSNRVTFLAVAGGLGIASGPFWADLVISLSKTYYPDSAALKTVSEALESYKAKADTIDVVGGVAIIFIALLYHLISHQIDKSRSVRVYVTELDHLLRKREFDAHVIENFNRDFPTKDLRELLAQVAISGSEPAIHELLRRYEYWRDLRIRFHSAELEDARKRLERAHLELAKFFQVAAQGSGEAERGRKKIVKALDAAYDGIFAIAGAYERELNKLKQNRGVV